MPQPPLRSSRLFPSLAAVLVAGGLVLGGLMLARAGRAAAAGPTAPAGIPIQPDPNAPTGAVAAPQPVAVQALDATHFVVVTREPRLVTRVGQDGPYVNMVLHVVTYYSVRNGLLVPIEHIHVPQGWRALTIAE